MRSAFISTCSAIALAILGWALPLLFPHVEPWIAKALLGFAGLLILMAVALWLLEFRQGDARNPVGRTANDKSTAQLSGTFSGPITFNSLQSSGFPENTNNASQRSEARYDLEKVSGAIGGALRALDLGSSGTPDFPLAGILVRLYKIMGPQPDRDPSRSNFWKKIDREIADQVAYKDMAVFGRIGNRALQKIDERSLRRGWFDHRKGVFYCSGDSIYPLVFEDLKFFKSEVDVAWPLKE